MTRKLITQPQIKSQYCIGHRAIVVSASFYPTYGGHNCRECHENAVRTESKPDTVKSTGKSF